MRIPIRPAVVPILLGGFLVRIGPVAAGDTPAAAEPVTVEIRAVATREPAVVDAASLVGAMFARYREAWPLRLTIRQEVTRFEGGKPGEVEIWNEVLLLPGRVRSTIGDPAAGNEEIYSGGTQVVLEGGKRVHEARTVHAVLLLGFDVYVQPPESTLARIAQIPVDTTRFHEAAWNGDPVYVVGAEPGDAGANQFWIDREHLALVRVITRSPRGNLIDVQFSDFRPVGGGWIAYRLDFHRNGELLLSEKYLEVGTPAEVDSMRFDLERMESP